MKKATLLLATFLLLFAALPASAQQVKSPVQAPLFNVSAFPGQGWTSLGDSSPVEHGNIQSEVYLEQGVTIFSADKGSITLTPYASIDVANDTYGYEWNNKVMPFGGIKLNKFFRNGILSANVGYAYEDRYIGDNTLYSPILANGTYSLGGSRGGAMGFINGWFGWQPEGQNRFPGSLWFTLGNVEPIEYNNVIGLANVQQGVVVARIGRVAVIPYAELRAGGDTEGYDWENKIAGGGGIKLAAPIHGIYTELGASVRHEDRFISGLSATGAYFFFNTSFDWNLFHRKGR